MAILVKYLPGELRKRALLCECFFGGCFVHRRPKVWFCNPTGTRREVYCEAGYFLVLIRECIEDKEQFRVVLFKAKIHAHKKTSIILERIRLSSSIYIRNGRDSNLNMSLRLAHRHMFLVL